jgi:hypothetical protein
MLDRIDMLLTGGLATLPVLDLAMVPRELSLLRSRSTRHRFSDRSFCLFLSCAFSSVYSAIFKAAQTGTYGYVRENWSAFAILGDPFGCRLGACSWLVVDCSWLIVVGCFCCRNMWSLLRLKAGRDFMKG